MTTPNNDDIRRERVTSGINKSMDAIVNTVNENYPTISESKFRQFLIPLLQKPYGEEFMRQWKVVVKELTFPLHVVTDGPNPVIVHTVPGLVLRPSTTIPNVENGLTLYHFMDHLKRDHELGDITGADGKTQEYLHAITAIPDYAETVLKPLRAILQAYGADFIVEDSAGNEVVKVAQDHLAGGIPANGSDSFTDEYED
jgi:hypothetical protein